MSARDRRTAERLHGAAKDLAWVASNWAAYTAALADYEARGWPDRTGDNAGRVAQGGTPTGINPRPDPVEAERRRRLAALVRNLSDIETVRRHVASIITPISLIPQVSKTPCRNLNCLDMVPQPKGDIAIANVDRCPPCDRYWKTHGADASARTVADRNRKRDTRAG